MMKRNRARFAVVVIAGALAALAFCWPQAARAAVADSEWPMFHHDNLHTGRTALPGPPGPALRWFQGGSYPEESGHRPPGPQGVIWSSPAEGSGAANARKVWYFHSAPWKLGGAPLPPILPSTESPRQLRSEAPETTTPVFLGPGSFDFVTSAAIGFTSAGGADPGALLFRNLDPSREDGVLPAGTWRFSFVGEAAAPDAVTVGFEVYAFPQGHPENKEATPLFSTTPLTLGKGIRRYEVASDQPAINLGGRFGVSGQQVGILVRLIITGVGGRVYYDGTSRTRIITPIVEPGVRVGCQDGSVYCANASTGNIMWAYWTGWPKNVSAPNYGTAVRSSPAIGSGGESFFGTEESPDVTTTGFVQGRFYSVGNDGSLRWVHPSSRQTFNLRSPNKPQTGSTVLGWLSLREPDVTATGNWDTYIDTTAAPTSEPFTDSNGNGVYDIGEPFTDTNGNDMYDTGFFQFKPAVPSTVSADPHALQDLTQDGWISKPTDFPGRLMPSGRFRFTLTYKVEATGILPRASLWYRISKVLAAAGTAQFGIELIGWTQASADQVLRPQSSNTTYVAIIDTDAVDETLFESGEFIYVELGIQQTATSTGLATWSLRLDDALDVTSVTTAPISDGPIGAVTSSPALSDSNTVYFGDSDATVWAIDDAAADDPGAGNLLRWNPPADLGSGNGIELSSPALDQTTGRNQVYVGTGGGRVFALDAGSGAILWQYPVAAADPLGSILSSPAVAENGDIYVGSDDGHVYALTSAGAPRWQFPAAADAALGPVRATVAISANGRALYFGSGDNPLTLPPINEAGLHALRLRDDGTFNLYLGQVATGAAVQSSPAVSTGGLRLAFFFRSDSEFSVSPPPAPDRWRLGDTVLQPDCIDFQRVDPSTQSLPVVGQPMPSNEGWLSGTFLDGERIETGTWDFSIQHATSITQNSPLYYRVSRVSLDASNNPVFRALLTGGASGWVPASFALTPSIYYFHQENGGVPTYGSIIPGQPPNHLTATLSKNPADTPPEVVLGSFVSPDGDPSAPRICGGDWQFHFRAWASTAGTASIRFDVYKQTAGGPVPLFSTPQSDPLNTVAQDLVIQSPQPDGFVIGPTDRLVVNVIATGTGVVNFEYEGDTNTRFSGPVPRVVTFSPSLSRTTFAGGERLFIEFSVPRQDTDPDWSLVTSSLSFVRTAPEIPPGEQVFFGADDGFVRSARLLFDSAGVPLNFEVPITWTWPGAARLAPYVSSPAVGTALDPGIGARPVVFIGGGDHVLICIGPARWWGPWALPLLPAGEAPQGQLLRVTKSANKQWVTTGGEVTVTYTIRVQNPSLPDPSLVAAGTTITDVLPAGLTYVSSTPPGRNVSGTIIWDWGDIEPQSSATVSFTATVTAEGTPPDPQPRVEVMHADFPDEGTTENSAGAHSITDPDRTTRWGENLYIRVTGRGEPAAISNQATAKWNWGGLGAAVQALSNWTTVYAGWGKRYQLEFSYDPANQPPGAVFNQIAGGAPLSYKTSVELAGTGQRTGRGEEAFEPPARVTNNSPYITVFKVQLAPRAYPYGPTAASVAQHPNRPWTPYFWKVVVRQQDPAGGWGDGWGTQQETDPWDFRVSNPLRATSGGEMGPNTINIGSTLGTNHGAISAPSGFSLTNSTRFSMTGAGLMPRNVVRWGDSDLGVASVAFQPGFGYDPRKEWYLPNTNLKFYEVYQSPTLPVFALFPREYANLAPAEVRYIGVSANVPKYLSPGTYQAPALGAPTAALPLYVDLNGNGSWDPGEAYLEQKQNPDPAVDEWVVGVEPPVFQIPVPSMTRLRTSAEALDLGRASAGTSYPGRAGVPIENVGNVSVDTTLGVSNLLRADAPWQMPTLPALSSAAVPLTPSPLTVVKTPVGSLLPLASWASAAVNALPDQPSGIYVGRLQAQDASVPLLVQLGEARKTGFVGEPYTDSNGNGSYDLGEPFTDLNSNGVYDEAAVPVPGADILPALGFRGLDNLNLFWSSNQKEDPPGSRRWVLPDAADPMYLYSVTLTRPAYTWQPRGNPYGPYPAAADDPMLVWPGPGADPDRPDPNLPPPWLRHVGAGYAADNANPASPGGELLAWVGSRLRGQGQRWDYRLLWSDWSQGASNAFGEDPPVSTRSTLMDSTPKSRASVARVWTDGGNQSAWVVVGQGSGESRSIEFLRMQRAGGAWLMTGKYPLPTSRALDFAADPCGFAWDVYPSVLHVAFAARARLSGNTDIYYGRWKVEGVDQPQPLTFRRVTGEAAERLTSRSFAGRHIEWAVGNGLWPQIYVADPSGNPQAIYDPATNAPRFDSQTGRYVIEGAHYYRVGSVIGDPEITGQRVEFDASAGAVYFPQAPDPVSLDYRPYLLRLTTHLGRDATPSAFIETYRDLDENGQPWPVNFNPRLWLFWVRSGTAGLAPRLYFKTYRWVPDAQGIGTPENMGWQEEIRANRDATGDFYPLDVGEQAVPLNRTVNELGISAVKDPRYAQVWLAWSSTRGAPSSQLTDLTALTSGTVNADLYLEPFAPPLPD
jgi:uncharacterized repeat protein (TIGR01451 family)